MSNVVFVRPSNPTIDNVSKKQGITRCPLNIALLASYIRTNKKYSCSIVDFEVINKSTPIEMAKIILQQNPKYVCFTTLTPRFPTVIKIIEEIYNLAPKVVNIIGGPHVTGSKSYSIDYPGVSYGIYGEGEEALLELLNALESGTNTTQIQNLIYKNGNTIITNPSRPFIKNIDLLPFPAWDLMDISKYLDPQCFDGPHMAVFTTRGCPYSCKFCASAVTWESKVRFRSAENVIEEIKRITNLGINNIMFHDDNFASSKTRALEICREIIKNHLNIKYTAQIRADDINDDLLYLLSSSGCQYIAVGVESGNQEILKSTGKKESKEQILYAIKLIKKYNIKSVASFILGFPEDTHETIKETINFAKELDADQSKFMILSVYPGTYYYELAKSRGLVDPKDFNQMEATTFYDSVSINISNVSDKDLLKYQDLAYNLLEE